MMDYEGYFSAVGRQLQESAIRRMGTVVARQTDLISFAPGYPDPDPGYPGSPPADPGPRPYPQ